MGKSLIIYFSRAEENYSIGYITKGNTEIAAEYVKELTGADIFKVEPLVPYASDYRTCTEEARQRIGHAPIKNNLGSLEAYDVIYVMSPIYWGTFAPEMETALMGLDFTRKTIRIITTHEGSGLGNVVSDVSRICKGARVDRKGLAIRGSQVKQSRDRIAQWLRSERR